MSARVLLVVLVVLVLLFALGAGCGATDRRTTFSCSREQQRAWMDRIFRPRPVASGEVSGCTTTLGRAFVVPGGCTVVVAPSADRFRRLVVKGAKARLDTTTDADGRSIVLHAELTDAGSEVTIGKDGGRINLKCDDIQLCQAVLE
jgi:hypothetical protein